ncbi:nuclear factor 7, brain-like isoform X2 [Myxocyprinus asiaticus]|uniref:nuclear factor 7, brain-like isoform X2 n=1 Tax=Myxocyprinus asiaticus TaxID=70543 RepID=UPI0022238E58|nr:nuclear factor 7, brain-like isoform X2 [Myxocyprinus asiaticus]
MHSATRQKHKMEGLLNTEEFCCPICLDLLKDPVASPCGHSYCMGCIDDYWNKSKEVIGCPQCGQTFSPRPILNRNTILAEMVEKMKKLELLGDSQIYSNYMPGDVACDYCTSSKQKAIKSCLVCLASYCPNHLQPHYKSPAMKKHKLIEASVNLQEKICPNHDKYLEMYCRTDQQCICLLCVMDDHKGHDTVSAASESAKKQKDLEMTRLKYKLKIHTKEMELLELKQAADSLKNCHSFSSSRLHDPPFTLASLSDFGKVNDAISAFRMKLVDVFKGEWLRIYQAAKSIKILHCTVPKIRSEFLHHSCLLQLNPLTAHKDLILSKENREVTVRSRERSCPDHPERFDYWCQVLGTEGLTGCSYWEVEWSGMGANIAVAYKNVARKGESSEAHFGHNDKSWSLFCYRKGYTFWHNGIVSKISEPGSSKVGVYVDHRAGTLAFYSIGDTMILLHRVQTRFTQPLYPGFEFSCYGALIKLCQLE